MQDHLCPQDAPPAFVHQLRDFCRGGSNLALSSFTSVGGRTSKAGWPSLPPFPVLQRSKPAGIPAGWDVPSLHTCCDCTKRCFCQALPGVCSRQSWGLQGRWGSVLGCFHPAPAHRTCLRLLAPLSKAKSSMTGRRMGEKQPQLQEKTGWSWLSWQAGAAACRAHPAAREKGEQGVAERKCTLSLCIPLGELQDLGMWEPSWAAKGGGQDSSTSCLCFSPSNTVVIGNKLAFPKLSVFCLWWEMVNDFILTHELFNHIFSPDLLRMGSGWGAGWMSGRGQSTTHARVFPTQLSALKEEYTANGRNVANPLNFLSKRLLLTEHKIFHFSN